MKKKLRNCTVHELIVYCNVNLECTNCPLMTDFGCRLIRRPFFDIPKKYLEREIEIPDNANDIEVDDIYKCIEVGDIYKCTEEK